jgi:ribonuclease BN (tRNA processing enzyme)
MKYNFLPLRSQGLSYANAVLETQEHAGVLWERAKTADNAEGVSTYLEKLHSAQTAAAEAIRSLRGEKAKEDNFPDIPDCENLRIYSAQASLLARCEAHLSFLGTGCAIPSKYRNVSGILLDLPARGTADQEDSALMIDAGESTWAQMLRLAHETENAQGMSSTVPEVSYRLARKIKIVWVSHPHADHHLGLVRVIAERKRALLKSQAGWSELPLEPLVVIAPGSVLAFLREYTALNGYLDGAYVAVSCRAFDPHDDCTYTDSYWNQDLLGAPHAVPEPSSPRSPGRGHHRGGEVKRQRLEEKQHAPAPGIHRSASFSSVGSASPPGEKPLHPVATTSDLTNMAMDTCEVNPADSSTNGGRGWRNFKAVFREEISTEVRELAAVAKAKALALLYSSGITSLMNVQVVHCGQSYGLCLEFDNGATPRGVIKLVYSGDTRPCDRLVEAGRGATVLIHEATFEDDKQAEAVSKRHSTMGEAADVGRRMGAYRVLFTHFSQRYPGVPQLAQATPFSGASADPDQHVDGDGYASVPTETSPMSPENAASSSSACAAPVLAFDFMRVALRDLLWAPAATALLAAAYPIGSSNSLDAAAAEVDNED